MQMTALLSGNKYIIKGYRKSIDSNYRHNLLSLGLVPGSIFLVKRFAPFSKTIQIEIEQLNQFNLSLRENELKDVLIESYT